MATVLKLGVRKKKELEALIQAHGYENYQWIDPGKIVVSQWVRMKCMFGFPIAPLTDYKQMMNRYAILLVA